MTMRSILLAVLASMTASPAQESSTYTQLKWLVRHQREDGAWSAGPVGCLCVPEKTGGKPDPDTRKIAATHLDALASDHEEIREKAIQALIDLGARVEPVLREFMSSEDPERSRHAAKALRRIVQARVSADQESTALALLAFLGAGFTHLSKDELEDRVMGPHLLAANKWLCRRLKASGYIGDKEGEGVDRAHVLATLALLEGHGITGTKALRMASLNALDYLVKQQRKSGAFGPGKDDLEIGFWCVLVLHSAKLSGFDVPKEVQPKLSEWLKGQSGRGDGVADAGWILMRALLDKDVSGTDEAAKRLASVPIDKPGALQRAALSLALLHHQGPTSEPWRRWKAKPLAEWTRSAKDGCGRGAFLGDPPGARSTSLNLIANQGLFVYRFVLGSPGTPEWPPKEK